MKKKSALKTSTFYKADLMGFPLPYFNKEGHEIEELLHGDIPVPVLVEQVEDLRYIEQIEDLRYIEQIEDLHYIEQVEDLQYIEQVEDLRYIEQVEDLQYIEQVEDLHFIV